MGQIIRKEIVGQLTRTSGTNVLLAQSVLNIGGQQYSTPASLLMNISASGFGGLDTGSVVASKTYHLYAVVNNANVVGLIASLNLPIANGPVGFPNWKYLWSIHTDQSSQILNFRRDGKRNVFLETESGIFQSPDFTVNQPALTIDSSGATNFPNNTNIISNAPTFTLNMLSGIADSYVGMWLVIFDGGAVDGIFQFWETIGGNIANVVNYWARQQNTGKLYQAQYAGQVGVGYTFVYESSPTTFTTREGHHAILSYENKLVDESSSAGTIVNIGANIPAPVSEIWARNFSSYGSAGSNKVVVWGTIQKNVGTAVTYVPDSVNGDYFLINETGLYAMTSSLAYTSAGNQQGITLNEAPGDYTTTVNALGTKVLAMVTNGGTTSSSEANAVTNLFVGDKIRVHSDAGVSDGLFTQNFFRIAKIANLAGTGGTPPPGPRSEIVVDTNASLGSVSGNQIVVWSNVQANTGSDITVTQDAANGWYFTIHSDGIYAMSTDVTQTGIAHVGISRNQSNLLTDITGVPANQRLTDNTSHGDNGSSNHAPSATTRLLNSGDIIRVVAGTSIGGQANLTYFSITKVSN